MQIYNILNYIIKISIFIIWIYLYYTESLTLNRIFIFIVVFLLIYGYSRFAVLINFIFLNEKVIKYINDNKEKIQKMLYVLLNVYKWINPFIVFLAYTDKWLYKINRYITGTKYIRYNFIVYVLLKYLAMFGLVKLIIYKYYDLWYKLYHLTIVEILFKRMFGLILSILIFSDILNNVIGLLSHYSIWIYVFIYYVLSILCVIWELLYYSFLSYQINNRKVAYLIYLFDKNLQCYTKMNVSIFLRSQFTWLGRIITDILEILIPKENNFKEDYLHLTKVKKGSYFMSGRINYYIPVNNRISFKYFDYFGGYIDFEVFEPTFELYWESFKSHLSYYSFFKPICEIKYKPSIFLYMQLQELAKLYGTYNQPINRLMKWKYFEIKYKECYKVFNAEECLIVSKNLQYLNKVDELRACLMYFIIWDIEYYYNSNNQYKNNIDYNYWIIQYDSIIEELIFQNEVKLSLILLSKNLKVYNKYMSNKKELKFYDPEENLKFLNRLFDVLGILDTKEINKYYVSKKFINYNKNYVELLKIMYTYDYKRWEEPLCECSYLSNYEVEISYKTEEYFYKLRKAWEESITKEPLEDRNWRLLKQLEYLMVKEF